MGFPWLITAAVMSLRSLLKIKSRSSGLGEALEHSQSNCFLQSNCSVTICGNASHVLNISGRAAPWSRKDGTLYMWGKNEKCITHECPDQAHDTSAHQQNQVSIRLSSEVHLCLHRSLKCS